jgi:hypothetical protein
MCGCAQIVWPQKLATTKAIGCYVTKKRASGCMVERRGDEFRTTMVHWKDDSVLKKVAEEADVSIKREFCPMDGRPLSHTNEGKKFKSSNGSTFSAK